MRGLINKVVLGVSYLPATIVSLGDTEETRLLSALEYPSRDEKPVKPTFQHHSVSDEQDP